MEKRRLGTTNLYASPIGLGCRTIHKIGSKKAIEIIREAIKTGINLIDTANIYGGGKSEEIVGEAIHDIREKVILATKGGIVKDASGLPTQDLSPKSVRKAVEESLKRLKTDYIDLYQIHYPDPTTPPKETVNTLMEYVDSGIIRHVGLSNISYEELKEWASLINIPSIQIPYNFLQHKTYDKILQFCQSRKISIIAYTPLLMGLLTEKVKRRFPRNDERSIIPPRIIKECERIVGQLKPIAEKCGKTVPQLILNWLINRPGIGCILVGMSKIEHVKENVEAMEWRMPSEIRREIDDIAKGIKTSLDNEFFIQTIKKVFSNYAGRKVVILEMGMKIIVPSTVEAGDRIKISWNGEYLGKY